MSGSFECFGTPSPRFGYHKEQGNLTTVLFDFMAKPDLRLDRL